MTQKRKIIIIIKNGAHSLTCCLPARVYNFVPWDDSWYDHLLHRYECFTVKYATRRYFIWNYIRDNTSDIFPISSQVKISLTSYLCFFLCFSSIFFYFRNTHIYVIKRQSHVNLNIWSLSSRGKDISRVSAANEEITSSELPLTSYVRATVQYPLYIELPISFGQSVFAYKYKFVLNINLT